MRALGVTAFLATVLAALAGTASAQQARALPALAPVPDDALSEALEDGELTEAEYVLERARSLFQLEAVQHEYGQVTRPEGRDATLVLRDLALRKAQLGPAERRAAERLLARPDDQDVPIGNGWRPGAPSAVACGAEACLHWVTDGSDADAPDVDDDDDPANGIPDWIDLTLLTFEDVWLQEVGTIGYRAPLSDVDSPNNGGGDLFDVYIDDLGADGVFGYCTSDDPDVGNPSVFAVSAYCVVDNDYAAVQYGTGHTPEEFLQVTAAHEFNHASQFAYDWTEDYWLLEGTATNMEETVYPSIDDNVGFLHLWSPLSRPGSPLDRAGFGDSEYGSWIFWRYLEEKVGGGDPGIVREIWERADAAFPGISPDDYSLLAVRRELTQRGLVFADAFATFGVVNRLRSYADAKAAGYPLAQRTAAYRMGPGKPLVRWKRWGINHLATRFFSFAPGRGAPVNGRLRINLRLPRFGGRASVIVVRPDGGRYVRRLKADANGVARRSNAFGRGRVRRVHLVLSNGSPRTRCWTGAGPPFYSCFGSPRDDGRIFKLRARFVRP